MCVFVCYVFVCCVCVWVCDETSISKFRVYNTVFLAIITMLSIRSPELIHLVTGIFYPLATSSCFLHVPAPRTTTQLFPFMNSAFLDLTYKWDNIVVILSNLFHLAKCPWGPPTLPQMARLSFSSWLNNIPL